MPLDKDIADEIIRSISAEGAASEENKSVNVILGSRSNLEHIVQMNSGMPRIRPNLVKSFKLILSQPMGLSAFSPFQIRCCLCNKVLSYPAWHYNVRYSVNHFHYFVCFNPKSSDKVDTKCYRRI